MLHSLEVAEPELEPEFLLHRIWLGRQEVRAGKDFGGASVPGSVAAGRCVTQWTPSFHQAIHH